MRHPRFGDQQRAALRKYLPERAIDDLERVAGSFYGSMQAHSPPPTSEVRGELRRFVKAIDAVFNTTGDGYLRGELLRTSSVSLDELDEAVRALRRLETGALRLAAELPRRNPHSMIQRAVVRFIADLVEQHGVLLSAASGSRFHAIAAYTFSMLGIDAEPTAAIRAVMTARKRAR